MTVCMMTSLRRCIWKFNRVDGHCFKVVDEVNGIDECDHLDETYNEAKLDIIFLAIFFQLINFSQIPAEHHKLLVMDDVINSLDMANRGLVAKFIMTHFQYCQILLLTHNVSFYNLFSYAISNYNNSVDKWQKRLLYEIGDTRVLVKDESPETVASIKADFNPEMIIVNLLEIEFVSFLSICSMNMLA